MNYNEVWKSKETKSVLLKIMGPNPDGTIKVTFDFRLNPRTTHNYTKWYLEQYYEYAGYESVWDLGEGLRPIPAPVEEEVAIGGDTLEVPAAPVSLDDIDPEKVLFGNYTGKDKVNVWKEVE